MELKEFARKVLEAVKGELGEGYRPELKEVRKNNGIVLQGLLIAGGEGNVIPTIYLESFYAAYEKGAPLSELVQKIIEIYREETPGGNVNMEFFQSLEKVRDRICYRLIRRQGNEELLKDIPYVEFLDLAICFYYAYSGKVLGEGSILIHNSHIERWGIKIRELMRLAVENTPKIFPAKITPMTEVLRDLRDAENNEEAEGELPMLVLTNKRRTHGAACILYPDLLKKAAEISGRSFYVLPSSIHEVILLEATGAEEPTLLKQMIYEINRTQVAPEEVLSDSLYFYDKAAREVKIIF